MALLQISEPGMAPEPHQRTLAVGIDLGTTNSLVAAVRSGTPEVILDEAGRPLLPSVVRYFPNAAPLVGNDALHSASSDPVNTIVSVKRLMGRGRADVASMHLPYRFADAPGMVRLETAAGQKSPVEVSAEILRVLRRRAEAALGADEVDGGLAGAVITVPAYFDDAQRQATKDAAALAGLNVLRLINEPTAAALAYGLDNASEGIYAVYDLGGGTFDVSILRMTKGVFEVIATGGDSALGGDDFDRALAGWLLAQAADGGERGPGRRDADQWMSALPPGDRRALQTAARQAKEALSDAPRVQVDLALSDGRGVSQSVSREDFERLTQALLERTLNAVRNALRDARLAPADVQGVVMVGGSTRMPQVQRAVGGLFGRPPLNNLDPDEVVALGAAIQANLLAGNRAAGDDWLLLDVIPLSLGLETMGGLVEKVVPRNSTIPIVRAQEFTTFKEGQTAMAIHVVQGERELVSDCRSLARFELRGIPPMAAGAARIRVVFQVDADGLLSVTAREQSTGVEATVAVKPSYGLSDDDIARMLRESFDAAGEDMQLRALREQQVEADRMIVATRNAVAADGDLLDEDERARIEEQVLCLYKLSRGDDHSTIKAGVEALARMTEPFAARRMDRAIAAALSGRRLDQLDR